MLNKLNKSRNHSETDPARSHRDCLQLIHKARVLTLGTMALGRAGSQEPWTAPVYYVFDDKCFYFFSSPGSRHVQEGEGLRCSASVFHDTPKVDALQGVQMSGQIQHCSRVNTALKIAAAYAGKYGIRVPGKDALAYFSKGFGAQLYSFCPDAVYFMDNSSGFGNRELIDL